MSAPLFLPFCILVLAFSILVILPFSVVIVPLLLVCLALLPLKWEWKIIQNEWDKIIDNNTNVTVAHFNGYVIENTEEGVIFMWFDEPTCFSFLKPRCLRN